MAFHPYPQLIQTFFNTNWFGPPPPVTEGSAWPWVDHSVSGLPRTTKTRYSHSLSLRLRQRLNLAVQSNSQAHYAKGMQQPLKAATACKRMVSGSISLPSTGFFSPFPHGTGALSVTDEYLALEGGPPGFRPRFTCEALLGILVGCFRLSHTGLSPCVAQHSNCFR